VRSGPAGHAPATGQAGHTLTGHASRVNALAVAPDGSWLASTSWDETVRIWDPHTGQGRHTKLSPHPADLEGGALLRRRRDRAELLHQAHGVHHEAAVPDLAVGEAIDRPCKLGAAADPDIMATARPHRFHRHR